MSSLSMYLSTSTLFNAYTNVCAFVMLLRTIVEEFIPYKLQDFIKSRIERLNPFSSQCTTILIDEAQGLVRNQVYNASETYLGTRINSSVRHLRVMKEERQQDMSVAIQEGKELIDVFEGTSIRWKNHVTTINKPLNEDDLAYPGTVRTIHRYYKLKFHQKDRDKVVSKYLPHVLSKAKTIKEENKVVKLHTLSCEFGDFVWDSVNMGHPASFDTLALDPEMKKDIMQDLDRFMGAKEFYRRVGKAWKRGYLLYGPSGTGKSTLIAAMANYLKFNVYDIEFSRLESDSELRDVLVNTGNRSILVVEDIDCTADLKRKGSDLDSIEDSNDGNSKIKRKMPKWSLSGLLNFTDGLWSSCGDERIIVFTTNHKDRLDPALLRPGRIDKHIHLPYLTMKAFDILAKNYLGITGRHQHEKHYKEIEDLMEKAQVTPAEVAEELMKSRDPDESLGGLVKFLKGKNKGKNETKDEKEIYST